MTVNPTPTVNSIANATYCNGAAAAAINFSSPTTGGAITYTWTSTLNVGFGLSGSGNIPAYTATNATNAPVTATISVTATANGCTGPATTFTVTVNPTPTVNSVANATYCNGAAAAAINFTTPTTGGAITYTWTSTLNVGFGLSGAGNIPAYTATNATNAPVIATVSVTATVNGCTGPATTFTVTVNPTPTVNSIANATYCNGAAASAINFTSSTTGGSITYTWTSTLNVGFGLSGTGSIPAYTAVNATNAPVIATVGVTATMNGCTGPATTFTVTVNPTPTVNSIANATYCNGAAASAINFTSPTSGGAITYNWTSTLNVGFGTNGIGNIPAYTATNAMNTPVLATVSVTATINGCTGPATTFTVTVNPTPTVNSIANATYCNGAAAAAINFSSPTTGGAITYN